jgi:hypothetical protein
MTKLNKYHREYFVSDKTYFSFILLGFAVALASCKSIVPTQEPRLVDKSFVTGQPCAAPCWYGLELDRSTESDVITKLKELPFVDPGAIRISDVVIFNFSNATEIDYGCADPKGELCGMMIISGGSLKVISTYIYYKLPLRLVIDQLGKPDDVFYTPYSSHGDGCLLDLDWLGKGITVRRTDRYSISVCQELEARKALDSELEITEIYYLAEEALDPNRCNLGAVCIAWPGFKQK